MKVKIALSLLLLLLFSSVVFAFFPSSVDLSLRFSSPTLKAPLGYDDMGRNYLAFLSRGTLTSLFTSFVAVSISFALGLLFSLLLSLTKRLYEVVLSFLDSLRILPMTVIAIFLSSFFFMGEARVLLSLVMVFFPLFTRISFMSVHEIREREYIVFLAQGGMKRRLVLSHILRHLWLSLRHAYVVYFSTSILVEATLSYLGLGVREEIPSLGSILANAKSYMLIRPSLIIWPIVIMLIIGLSLSLLSSSLRELDSPLKRPLKGKLIGVSQFSPDGES